MTEYLILQNKIQGYLTRLNDMVIMSNKAGQYTLTKSCESLICEIFSITEGVQFSNTNFNTSNFPAIDLHNLDTGLAIQVTSNVGNNKIVDSLRLFLKKGFDNNYKRLLIVVLANKKYDIPDLQKRLKTVFSNFQTSFDFDLSRDIIDLGTLYAKISNMEVEVVTKIAKLLQQYFDEFVAHTNLADYYERLKSQFFETVMDDEKGMTLNGIYVEPSFKILEECFNKESKDAVQNNTGNFTLNGDVSIHDLLNKRFSKDNTYDFYLKEPKAKVSIILGYPGQGKTSMCNKLLFDLLTSPREKNVFYVKLRNINDTRALISNPFNVIFEELQSELDATFTKAMLKNSITILDGLDELYMKDNLNADHIETFVKGVIHEADKFGKWEVMITTRHGYINFNRLYRESYNAFILDALNLKRQLIWVDQYRAYHPESWLDQQFVKEISGEGNKTKHFLDELINQPLLLYIIASLEKKVDGDANRTEIYNLLFDQIIDRKYSRDGQIENLKSLTKDDLRFMLQEIAYLIFRSGKGFLTTAEVLAAEGLEDIITKIGDSHLSTSLKGILISFYFREVKKTESDQAAGIEFFHKSLQEYLTAERIVGNVFYKLLNKDQSGNYLIKKGSDLLPYLNDIFGAQEITTEIWDFMTNLIEKKSLDLKTELCERLVKNINYLFEKDFIAQVESKETGIILKIIYTCTFYWYFLKILSPNRDFMNGQPWVKKYFAITAMLAPLEMTNAWKRRLSFQSISHLDTAYMDFFSEPIEGLIIRRSMFDHLGIYNCGVKKVNIIDSFCSNLELNTCSGNINFSGCDFSSAKIQNHQTGKVSFLSCNLYSEVSINMKKKSKVEFFDCRFSEQGYANLKKGNGKIILKDCKMTNPDGPKLGQTEDLVSIPDEIIG